MIKIENGRTKFFQWDIDQRLLIDDPNIIEVHFANATSSTALVCEVYEENGERYANVPNILLQQPWPIAVYGCCHECVRDEATYQVVRRERPDDYVYTETEVKRYDDLEKRVTALEQGGGGSGSGGDGKDGISPIVNATEVSGGYRIDITDAEGTESITLRHGKDGSDGAPGKDGEPGKDGSDGAPGPAGPTGKTAYQYAQDGGYTGTEAEFTAKMAGEIPDGVLQYTPQTLTAEQQEQARENIAAASGAEIENVSSEVEALRTAPAGSSGQYSVTAYVRNGKLSYVLVPHTGGTNLYPIDINADVGDKISANDLFYYTKQFAQGGQDGAFAHDKLFRCDASGNVHITDIASGTVLQTMELDKKDASLPHANSVSILQGEPTETNLVLALEPGSYDSGSGGAVLSDARASTGIFAIGALDNLALSVTNMEFIICCYDAGGGYLGQVSKGLNSFVKGSGQWLPANTMITKSLLEGISSTVKKIAVIAAEGAQTQATYTATYDDKPLWLYANIYNNYADAEDRRLGECCVYRISFDGNAYSNELSHIIKIGFTGNMNLWVRLNAERPYGNFVVDAEHNKLYVYVSDWTGAGLTRWHEFNLPSAGAGVQNDAYGCPVVTLRASDILASWGTKQQIFPQGACYYDGKAWCASGLGTGYSIEKIHVVDLAQRVDIGELDVDAAGIVEEPEFVDFYNGVLYYGTVSEVRQIHLS